MGWLDRIIERKVKEELLKEANRKVEKSIHDKKDWSCLEGYKGNIKIYEYNLICDFDKVYVEKTNKIYSGEFELNIKIDREKGFKKCELIVRGLNIEKTFSKDLVFVLDDGREFITNLYHNRFVFSDECENTYYDRETNFELGYYKYKKLYDMLLEAFKLCNELIEKYEEEHDV